MNQFEPISAVNLSVSQINTIADRFAQVADYKAGESSVFECVKKLGGRLEYFTDFSKRNPASITVKGPHDFTIRVSNFTSSDTDVFTVAHELGHFVLHSYLGKKQIEAAFSSEHNRIEEEANVFAYEFLMPQEQVKLAYRQGIDIIDLASRFNVSARIMYLRMGTLGLQTK